MQIDNRIQYLTTNSKAIWEACLTVDIYAIVKNLNFKCILEYLPFLAEEVTVPQYNMVSD